MAAVPGPSAFRRLLSLAAFALAAAGDAAAAGPATIYGLELEVSSGAERLLVLADAPISARILEQGRQSLLLGIEGAVLDRGLERRLEPVLGEIVERATAIERGDPRRPEVRILIDRAAGPAPRLASAGTLLAIEFPRPAPPRPQSVNMDFREAPLEQIVRRVAESTDETYAFDDGISGSITIIAPEAVTASEARALLDAALLFKGYAAVRMAGRGFKIVPVARAPAAFRTELDEDAGDAPVTTLLRLESSDAEALLAALRPLLGANTLAFSHQPGNGLILVGSERRLARLARAIRALDAAEDERTLLWRVHHRGAAEIADQLAQAFDETVLLAIDADERSNLLILRARSQRVAELRDFVERLDRPPVGGGALHVIPVQHVDADLLAATLENLRAGGRQEGQGIEESELGYESLAGRDYSVVVDRRTRSLIVRADPETAALIADVVAALDRIPAQIRVEVTVAEVSAESALSLGFDYLQLLTSPEDASDLIAGVLGNPSGAAAGSGALSAGWRSAPLVVPLIDPIGVPIAGVDPTVGISEFAILTADQREVTVRSLLNPSLLVSSGDEHEIFAGDNVPIPVAQSEAADPLETRQDIERKDVGLLLRVRPSVGQQGRVHLELDVEVSAVRPSLAGDEDRVGPTFSQREVSTVVDLDPGAVAVVGFALLPRQLETVVGVPFLRSVPILGFLFRSSTTRQVDTTLLVSVRASVEREETAALVSALRHQLAQEAGAVGSPGRPL